MNYTIVQARLLLTQPELAVFQSSRGEDLRACTAKQLVRKIVRARALRDKYRDLYRRQTVAERKGASGSRAQSGDANERTRKKAELFAQVLVRFEDRFAALGTSRAVQAAGARKAKPRLNGPGAPTDRSDPPPAQRRRRSVGDAKPSAGADLPMRGASGIKTRGVQRQKLSARQTGAQVVEQRAAGSAKAAAGKRPTAKKPAADRAAPTIAGASLGTPTSLTGAVGGALERKQARRAARPSEPAATAPARAPGRTKTLEAAGRAVARGASPNHAPASAQRANPLKADPGNQKIHASARGRHKAFQAKRDSRSGR